MGHMVEYIQTDIWVRFQKLRGHSCIYVCASDAHGTPIMLKARELGITPEELTAANSKEFVSVFESFGVDFDNYHTTHSPENEALTVEMYEALRAAGDIYTKTIEQAYDEKEGMFLPDRFVKGTCPRCKSEDQYGDACEVCGATYAPADLLDPVSVLSGTTPVKRQSEHYFFRLSEYTTRLREWMAAATLDKNVIAKLEEWFDAGLQDWDISRDAPYFGFRIPDTEDKYFYVWLDAPVGYPASFKHLCDRRDDLNFEEYWRPGHETELYHFIGKDIMYFHTLFWPAVLAGAGFRTPTSVYAHGFLTVNGQKMSKSRGTFIKARTYLDNLDPSYLRYYYSGRPSRTSILTSKISRPGSTPISSANSSTSPAGAQDSSTNDSTAGWATGWPTLVSSMMLRRLPIRSQSITNGGNTPRRCALSWGWPTPQTGISTRKSRGSWPGTTSNSMPCKQCARRGSTIFGR